MSSDMLLEFVMYTTCLAPLVLLTLLTLIIFKILYIIKLFIINLRNTVYFISNLRSVSQGVCIELGLILHCLDGQLVTIKIRFRCIMWTSKVVSCRANCLRLAAKQRRLY